MARWMGCWCKIICSSHSETGKKMGWESKKKRIYPNFSQRRAARLPGTWEERCLSAGMGHGWVSQESWLKWSLSQELDGQLISSGPEGELGLWQGHFILHRTHTRTQTCWQAHPLLLTSFFSLLFSWLILFPPPCPRFFSHLLMLLFFFFAFLMSSWSLFSSPLDFCLVPLSSSSLHVSSPPLLSSPLLRHVFTSVNLLIRTSSESFLRPDS